MNLENSIKDVIEKKLEDGTVEKLIEKQLEQGINKSLENLLGSYGDVTKVIEDKIKEVMLNQLSGYDYSKYVVKLDCVLTEILKKTALDHKKILENFKELMTDQEVPRIVKVSDIFEEYKKYVSENVCTGDLEVVCDGEPRYEDVSVSAEVEEEKGRSWASFKHAKIIFECENDEEVNFELRISKFQHFSWQIDTEIDTSIRSLKHLDKFKIYILKLYQSAAKIEIDEDFINDEVEPEAMPEADFT